MIDDYFKVNLLLTSCVHTTGKQVELTLGQLGRERVWALSAKQANLIRDRSISSSANILLFNYQTFALFFVKVMNITVSRKADFSESWILRNKMKIRGWKWSFRKNIIFCPQETIWCRLILCYYDMGVSECDQIDGLFVQFLAIYSNEYVAKEHIRLTKVSSKCCQIPNEPFQYGQSFLTSCQSAKCGHTGGSKSVIYNLY